MSTPEPLDEFAPEAEDGAEPATVSPPAELPSVVSVDEIQSRQIALAWYEALAIVQTVCAHLVTAGNLTSAVLDAKRILLDGAGAIHLETAHAAGGRTALQEASQLLHALLPDHGVPAPLRVAASQAAVLTSLQEWSASLEYYERPHRSALIREVFKRTCAAANASALAGDAVSVAVFGPAKAGRQVLPVSARRKTFFFFPRVNWRKALAASAAAVVAGVCSAAIWYVGGRFGDESEPLQSLFVTATAAVDELAGRLSPASADKQPRTLPAPVEPPPRARIPTPVRPSPSITLLQGRVMPMVRSVPLSADGYSDEEPRLDVSDEVPEIVLPPTDDKLIYSAADLDVVPPVTIYPRFPTALPPGVDPEQVAEFEVVVSASGEVESVKARRSPSTISEALAMMTSLSAAKSWRFQPGVKNGAPVKYRHVVRVLRNR